MPNTKDATFDQFWAKILLYAPSGFGKTKAFGTMPPPRYLLNFDRVNRVVLEVDGVDCEYDDILVNQDRMGYEKVLAIILKLKDSWRAGKGPKSVCVDTGRDLQQVIHNYIRAIKSKGSELGPLSQPDRGMANERYISLLHELLDAPCHLLFTFHQVIDRDDITGAITGDIALEGRQLPLEVFRKFNIKLHGVIEQGEKPGVVKRLCYTVPTTIFPADDKTGCLDPVEPDPDLGRMIRKIEAKYAERAKTKGGDKG